MTHQTAVLLMKKHGEKNQILTKVLTKKDLQNKSHDMIISTLLNFVFLILILIILPRNVSTMRTHWFCLEPGLLKRKHVRSNRLQETSMKLASLSLAVQTLNFLFGEFSSDYRDVCVNRKTSVWK